MSNAIFPVLPGLSWNTVKVPTWSTKIQKSVNGRELRASFYANPIWKWTLNYEVIRSKTALPELANIIAFYNLRQGSFDSFLYTDPTDYTTNNQVIGVGNGSTKTFTLLHSIGTWTEPIGYSDNIVSVTVNDVPVITGITNDGVSVTFATAPASGAVIKWGGTFYYRVRFAKDENDFENFMKDLWNLKKLELVTAR